MSTWFLLCKGAFLLWNWTVTCGEVLWPCFPTDFHLIYLILVWIITILVAEYRFSNSIIPATFINFPFILNSKEELSQYSCLLVLWNHHELMVSYFIYGIIILCFHDSFLILNHLWFDQCQHLQGTPVFL